MTMVIEPERYYTEDSLRVLFDLESETIREACEAGELRFRDLGGRMYFKGTWLVEWLDQPVRKGASR